MKKSGEQRDYSKQSLWLFRIIVISTSVKNVHIFSEKSTYFLPLLLTLRLCTKSFMPSYVNGAEMSESSDWHLYPRQQRSIQYHLLQWQTWRQFMVQTETRSLLCVCVCNFYTLYRNRSWAGILIRYNDYPWARLSGDQIPITARFSASVQTGPGANPAACTTAPGRSRR